MKLMILLLVVCVGFSFGAKPEAKEAKEFECVQCNSYNHDGCGEGMSDMYIRLYSRSCKDTPIAKYGLSIDPEDGDGAVNASAPSGCRKIQQELTKSDRWIRTCAFAGGAREHHKITANNGIRVFVWQCEGSKCNGTPQLKLRAMILAFIPVLMALLLKY